MSEEETVLSVRDLDKHFSQSTSVLQSLFRGEEDPVQAVDGVSFDVEQNVTKGIVGESGCGKTTLLETLAGLTDPTDGKILFKGRDTSEFGKRDWKQFRRRVQIIFQDPFNSLDPKFTVEETLMEVLKIHDLPDKEERITRALRDAELSPVESYLDKLPKHLSGGEKQRVSIARALILEPELILADEPVSMLDVSTQAAILNLLSDLTTKRGVSMLYISHDLSTVSYVCDEINVMYLGRIVESAPTADLIADPKHPYSQALVDAIPIPDPHHDRQRTAIKGSPSDPIGIGEGCRFRDRCPERMDVCEITPKDVSVGENRTTACHLHYDHESTDHDCADTGTANGD